VAQGLVNVINADSAAFVRAGIIGTEVVAVSKATQNANYPLSTTYAVDDPNHFNGPAFTSRASGPTLTGSP
jgi:hypothetical protein